MNSNKPSPNLVSAFITNIAVNFYTFNKHLNFAASNILNEINVNTLSLAHNILAKNITYVSQTMTVPICIRKSSGSNIDEPPTILTYVFGGSSHPPRQMSGEWLKTYTITTDVFHICIISGFFVVRYMRTALFWAIIQCEVRSGNYLPTFRYNLSAPTSRVIKVGPIGCPETSVSSYHFALYNSPEERSSLILHVISNR